jgi:patatin-related protein
MAKNRPREVRLGIVMYGGVSLAVYENGVAQELFRAVKGEGIYRWIKDLIDSDILVDIISGTSAGGINGILLGYALANNKDFRGSATLWREGGDILQLLRQPSDPNTFSILDSRGYYQERLEAAFTEMPTYSDSGGAEPSEVKELDLFVTGTDVHGKIFTAFDDGGNPIDVKEHKQVFVLSYRQGRKNEFTPNGHSALAKLARITSCFPVAFEPVHVTESDDPADVLLRRWGATTHDAYYLDGGVLDNKPFSSAIDAIFRRTADREVSRTLMYVEPDPERFTDVPLACTPNIVQAATRALVSIPGYQSISSDLKSIALHNDCVQRYNEICRCVPPLRWTEPLNYLDNRASQLSLLDADDHRKTIYLTARFTRLRDRVLEGVLNDQKGRAVFSGPDRHAARVLVQSFEAFQNEIGDVLEAFDVYYRSRRLFHLTYFIYDRIASNAQSDPKSATAAGYRDLWRRLNHHIKVLEMIQFAMESAVDQAPIEWRYLRESSASADNALAIWGKVQNVMTAILDTAGIPNIEASLEPVSGLPVPDRSLVQHAQREDFMTAMHQRIRSAATNDGTISVQPAGNLFTYTDKIEREVLKRFAPLGPDDPVCQEYCRFIVLDSYVYPMLRMAGLESTDLIKTVRVSPIDAKFGYSPKAIEEKLCGIQLGHFGAFLKASWRANDVMWGRLDGVSQIVQCLVTPDRLQRLSNAGASLPSPEALARLFPHSSNEERNCLFAQAESAMRATDGNGQDFNGFLDLLVRAAQREILHEEVPNVIHTAIRQQADWNHFDIDRKAYAPLLNNDHRWVTGVKKLDPAVTSYAAIRLAEDTKAQYTNWHTFFERQYRVGTERWNSDVPRPVLLEILATTALVLRNCLVAVAGNRAKQLRSSLIYQFGLNWPLLLTYHFASLQRRAPEYISILITIFFTICLAILAVDILQFDKLFIADNAVQWSALLLWMGVPLAALFLFVCLLAWSKLYSARLKPPRV